MGRKCCAPGCHSGYASNKENEDGMEISFFQFPKDEALRARWIQAIPWDKKTWCPTDNSAVCSLHFAKQDFVTESQDKNVTRQSTSTDKALKRKKLKPGVTPTIFPNLPGYFTKEESKERSGNATSATRRKNEESRLQEQITKFINADQLTSLDDLSDSSLILSSDVHLIKRAGAVTFIGLFWKGDIPNVKYSLTITSDLCFSLSCMGVTVPNQRVSHIIEKDTLGTLSSVSNILAYLKSLCGKDSEDDSTSVLQLCADMLGEIDLSGLKAGPKIMFLREQLILSTLPSNRRRYSSDMLIASSLWKATSPALYKQLIREDMLTLPSIQHLRHLSMPLRVDLGMSSSSIAYLKARSESLSKRDKESFLMVDEVFNAQRMEYCGGMFFGLLEGKLSKTLLAFMIKSIMGSYSDVVSLVPVTNLDSSLLKKEFDNVMRALYHLGFEVLATSMDNATPNRKLYTNELCDGELKPSVDHPCMPNKPLFLLFDNVHNFKNVFNNFHTKREFIMPSFPGQGEGPDIIVASFGHLEALYELELGKAVKIAHKLLDKVLHPKPIEKTNVQLADSFFHESTYLVFLQ